MVILKIALSGSREKLLILKILPSGDFLQVEHLILQNVQGTGLFLINSLFQQLRTAGNRSFPPAVITNWRNRY